MLRACAERLGSDGRNAPCQQSTGRGQRQLLGRVLKRREVPLPRVEDDPTHGGSGAPEDHLEIDGVEALDPACHEGRALIKRQGGQACDRQVRGAKRAQGRVTPLASRSAAGDARAFECAYRSGAQPCGGPFGMPQRTRPSSAFREGRGGRALGTWSVTQRQEQGETVERWTVKVAERGAQQIRLPYLAWNLGDDRDWILRWVLVLRVTDR